MRIMKRLGKPMTAADMAALIMAPRPNDIDKAELELFDLVCSDNETKAILHHYGANRANIEAYYQRLSGMGQGRWIRKHYLSAASIALKPTLTYLLQTMNATLPDGWSENDRWIMIVNDLVHYFESGTRGPVRSQFQFSSKRGEKNNSKLQGEQSGQNIPEVTPDFIDVTRTAKDVGMGFDILGAPVAVSRAVWDECILWSKKDNNMQTYQEQDARLWDVLFTAGGTLKMKINQFVHSKLHAYSVECVPRDGSSTDAVQIDLVIRPIKIRGKSWLIIEKAILED